MQSTKERILLHIFLIATFAVSRHVAYAASHERAFIDELFAQYGEKNASVITQVRFNDLLKQLTLGNVYVEKLEKSCLNKGIHTGYNIEPQKIDHVSKMTTHAKFVRQRRSGDHGHDTSKQTENREHQQHMLKHRTHCLSRKHLLQSNSLNDNDPISRDDFVKICPALIQQINSGVCLHRHNCSEGHLSHGVNSHLVWAYGFVAITVVSLASLCIIAVIPCLEKSFYQRIMGYLVALAVGTLAGDALLHLIPHAFQSLLGTSEAEHQRNIWKSCFVLLGIYAFFMVEQLMKIKARCCCKKGRSKSTHNHREEDKLEDADMKFSDLTNKDSSDRLHDNSCACHGSSEDLSDSQKSPNSMSDTEMLTFSHITVTSKHEHNGSLEHHEAQNHSHGHAHGKIDHNSSIATVAWMVIVGDGFHNFSDGLAIGAAFAASYSSGISTAIAVFCHELPHEIGDFAVLIKSGMTIRQAICYNIVSAVLSYIGMVIGILVGNYSDDGKQFALALTAGLFLYVSLTIMLPELTSNLADGVVDFWACILPHLGIASGITIMLLISIYEDKF